MNKIKLNLGCGKDYRKGWINVDIDKSLRPDVVCDFNHFPYPFEDNYADYILMDGVLEHLDRPEKVIEELWRISKPDAIIRIIVPYYKSFRAYAITHRWLFTEKSFGVFDPNSPYHFQVKAKLKPIKIKKICSGKRRFIPFKWLLDKFLWECYHELDLKFRVVK